MKKLIAVAVLTLAVIGLVPCAEAQPAPMPPSPPLPSSPVGVGPWIVAGLGVSVLSVMAYAAVIGSREHRELTSTEAFGAITFPFVWLVVRPYDASHRLTRGTGSGIYRQMLVNPNATTLPPR
jgi:tellurite resistance protein TehA-like permease